MATILLCSSNLSVKKRWASLLAEDYTLLQASTAAKLKDRFNKQGIDLLLIHRAMVDVKTMANMRRLAPNKKFFILSDQPDEDEGLTFLKLGVIGYANTYISPARLSEAVRLVISGSVWVGQKIMQRLVQDTIAASRERDTPSKQAAETSQALKDLTDREMEIAKLVAKGESNLEIAYELDITERTVKAHLSSVYNKTSTGNRLNLALLVNQG